MSKNRVATSKDVALLAGVSQSTVSRAFSSNSYLAAETREKVMAAARKLDYKPNALARSLVSTHSDIIGIIKGETTNTLFNKVLSEVVRVLQKKKKRVIYYELDEQESVDEVVERMIQFQIEGIVMLYATLSSNITEACMKRGIPVLQIHRHSTSVITNSVLPDNYQAAADAAAMFLEKGFRHFVYIAGEMNSSSNLERQFGFMKQLKNSGAEQPLILPGSYTYESGAEAMKEALAKGHPNLQVPCAILCANDLMACGAIDAIKYSSDLKIGKDVILIGFDNVQISAMPPYSLSTYEPPVAQMVDDGLGLLFENIENKKMVPVEKRYALTFIERQSTRMA